MPVNGGMRRSQAPRLGAERAWAPARVFVSGALAFALLLGCAVGPDYAPPETRMPDRWHHELVRGLSEGQADMRTWWLLLDDPALDRLIETATRGNLDVRRAVSRLLEARARVGLAAGEELPSVEAQGEVERGRLSEGVQEELGSSRARTSTLYQLGLDASWELDLWGRIGRNVESADAALQATVEDYRDVLVSLYAEVATTYVEIRTLQARIDAAQGNVDTQRQTLQLVRDRRRAELASDVEIAQAQLNLSTTEALIPQLRIQLQQAIHRLGVLLGQPPTALYGALEQRPVPQPPARVAIGLPADLLRQRPDIRSAERRLAAQTAQIGVATADLYPRFTLSGFLAFQKYGPSSFFNGDNIGYGLGPTVIWNVFDGGRIRSNIAVQDAADRAGAVPLRADGALGAARNPGRARRLRPGERAARHPAPVGDRGQRRGAPGHLALRLGAHRFPERPGPAALQVPAGRRLRPEPGPGDPEPDRALPGAGRRLVAACRPPRRTGRRHGQRRKRRPPRAEAGPPHAEAEALIISCQRVAASAVLTARRRRYHRLRRSPWRSAPCSGPAGSRPPA